MWMLKVDVDHLEQSIYLYRLVPQGTNKDIHRHRVMYTQDDVHGNIRLPCPLSYQQEGLWLLELVQDVEVVCTCPCQDNVSEVCWRSHPQELSSSSSSGSTSS